MKEFVKTVKQTFGVSKDDLIAFSAFTLCGGILGIVITVILMSKGEMEGAYANIGAMVGMIIGIMLTLIVGIFNLQQDFNLAISLGKTRKHYLPARFLFMVLSYTVCFVSALLICLVENLLYTMFFPGTVCEFNMMELLWNPAALVGILFLVPAITFACGACYLKFGAKCMWVFWVLWMTFCISLPRIINATQEETNSIWKRLGEAFVNFVSQLTALQVVIGMLIAGLVALGAACALLRKQRVTA